MALLQILLIKNRIIDTKSGKRSMASVVFNTGSNGFIIPVSPEYC